MRYRNISVIMATYNGDKFIRQQIDSILRQTEPPDEIIICDDRSTDDTVNLIKPYLNNRSIRLFINTQRVGVVANFKKAAKQTTTGNWIVFCDQDDIWCLEKLKKLKREMYLMDDGGTPALIYSDLTVIDKDNNIIAESFWAKVKINPLKINFTSLLYGNVVTGCTMMINYSMAQEFFVMDDKKSLHDEWIALIAYSFGKVKVISEQLVLYRQHDTNVTFSKGYEKDQSKNIPINFVRKLFTKPDFLLHQSELVSQFLSTYSAQLNDKQLKIIEKFICSRNKSLLYHKIKTKFS